METHISITHRQIGFTGKSWDEVFRHVFDYMKEMELARVGITVDTLETFEMDRFNGCPMDPPTRIHAVKFKVLEYRNESDPLETT